MSPKPGQSLGKRTVSGRCFHESRRLRSGLHISALSFSQGAVSVENLHENGIRGREIAELIG